MQELNQGLIYTNDDCIGCNKCISGCPIISANVVVKKSDGTTAIQVDGTHCIHCGHCLEVCEHNARQYRDDTQDFFDDLAKGNSISLLVAPAFIINYPTEYKHVLGYLKHLGIKHIYSVSFGADITTWAYLKYITENNVEGSISQPCPAIVNYIEHYQPDLLDKLIPVHSPVMCTAIYLQKYLHNTDKLAFISPCIAKKDEFSNSNTHSSITYNITFTKLMEHLIKQDISKYDAADELEYGLGSIYPLPGGLKENVESLLGCGSVIKQIEGETQVYHYFEKYAQRVKDHKKLPLLVDALNCSHGCIYGTATESKKDKSDDLLFEVQKFRANTYSKKTFDKSITPDKRLLRLNAQFETLTLQDFIRNYNHNVSSVTPEISEKEYQDIFIKMHKDTKEKQSINCSSCGYASCKDMALAIANNYNYRFNCVHYMKDKTEHEKQEIQSLLDDIKAKQQHEDLFAEISSHIRKLDEAIQGLAQGNDSTSQRTSEMAASISELSSYGKRLEESLLAIEEFIKVYEDSNKEIVKISSQTNILALNAGIEAARSGEAGKAFSVIATRVKELADKTNQAVQQGKENSQNFIPNIMKLSKEAKNFIEQIESLDTVTQEIAAVSEEIASQSSEIANISEQIEQTMSENFSK